MEWENSLALVDNVLPSSAKAFDIFKLNPLKTSPEYTQVGVLWEMRVVAKSVRLQRVKT